MSKMLTKSKGKEVLPMGRVQKSRKASWKRWLCPGLFCQRQTAEAQNSSWLCSDMVNCSAWQVGYKCKGSETDSAKRQVAATAAVPLPYCNTPATLVIIKHVFPPRWMSSCARARDVPSLVHLQKAHTMGTLRKTWGQESSKPKGWRFGVQGSNMCRELEVPLSMTSHLRFSFAG